VAWRAASTCRATASSSRAASTYLPGRRHGVRGQELLSREVGELVLAELVRQPAAPVRGLDVLHVPAVHLEPALA
jgi:hypothetical protein